MPLESPVFGGMIMKIGVVKEIKSHEYRVGLTPVGVRAFVSRGHSIYIEKSAGEGSGFPDDEFRQAGANIIDKAEDVWSESDMLIKVKEPIESEYKYLRKDLILYTYLHLAADRPLTDALLKSKTSAIAYETISDASGELPCLTPMSEIAGRLSVQEGAKYLEKPMGGLGILLGGVPGVRPANVLIIGGGTVGTNAAKMALGLGAQVTVLDSNPNRLRYLDDIFHGHATTLHSSEGIIEDSLPGADLLIGAVLMPGHSAPKLVKKEQLATMRKGAVIVDVAVDQGGCVETTHPTTHDDPTYAIDGVLHYCVANMPGAVPKTSTLALLNATLGYGLKIADMGIDKAFASDPGLAKGLNCYDGEITCPAVAESFGLPCGNN